MAISTPLGIKQASAKSARTPILTAGLGAGIIVLLAFGVRMIRPDFLSLNDDEAFFVQLAYHGNFLQLMGQSEPHPPLYLFLLQWWMGLAGVTEYAIRFPTIVFGVLTVAATYRLGKLLGGVPLGLAAAFVAALNPYQILYSETARDYQPACFFGLLSFFFLLKALRKPHFIPAYVLAALAAVYSHYYAIAIVLFEQLLLLLWLLGRFSWDQDKRGQTGERQSAARWRRWILADGVIVAAYLPWLAYSLHTIVNYAPGHGTVEIVARSLRSTFDFYNFGGAFRPSDILWPSIAVGVVLVIGLAGLAVIGGRRLLGLSVGYQLAPFVFALGTMFHTTQFGARFLFIGSPGYYLVFAGAIVLLWRYWYLGLAPAAFAAYLGGTSVRNTVLTDEFVTTGYRSLAAYLGRHVAPGDAVVLDGVSQWFSYWYYAQVRNHVRARVEFMPKDATGQGADATPVDLAKTEAALQDLAGSSAGIWFIDADSLRYDPKLDTERLLATRWYQAYTHNFLFQRLEYYGLENVGPAAPKQAHMDGFDLVEASRPAAIAAAGRPLGVALTWQASRDGPPAFKVSLRLLDSSGLVLAQEDGAPDGGFFQTSNWKRGTLLHDNHGLVVPVGTPPGQYKLELVAYDAESARSLGPAVDLGNVTINQEEPQRVEAADLLPVGAKVDGAELLAGGIDRQTATAGDRLLVTLLWSGDHPPSPASVNVALGPRHVQHEIGGQLFPPSAWRPGQLVRDWFWLHVPAGLEPGTYPLRVGPAVLGTVKVLAVAHSFTEPPVAHAAAYRFGDVAQLIGYDSRPGATSLHVELAWKSLGETDTSYTVFVHALGADGNIYGQADVAAGTDHWVNGEYRTTTYDISLRASSGPHTVEIGLYDPATGKRLPVCVPAPSGCTPDGDSVRLFQVPGGG